MSKLKSELLLFFASILLSSSIQAAVIEVSGGAVDSVENGNCSIVEAFQAANMNTIVDECVAGDDLDGGGDIVQLSKESIYVFNAAEQFFSSVAVANRTNALPLVTSKVMLQGNGATIERDLSSSYAFRFISIEQFGDLSIEGVTFKNGLISDRGGAVRCNGCSRLFINESMFVNNMAGLNGENQVPQVTRGGAIAIDAEIAQVKITNSTFSSNSAVSGLNRAHSYGGAISVSLSDLTSSRFDVINSTFSENQASYAGGAIYFSAIPLEVNVLHSTFYNNQVSLTSDIQAHIDLPGSAVYIDDLGSPGAFSYRVNIEKSIFQSSEILPVACGQANESYFRFSDVLSNDASCGDIAERNLKLAPLADNGGSTQTHALLKGSPAIGTDYRSCAVDPQTHTPLAFDQRGSVRDDKCDLGAFEYVAQWCFDHGKLEVCGASKDLDNNHGFPVTDSSSKK